MSRIYDDQKLQNLPLINRSWSSSWNTKTWTEKGDGVLVEGTVQNRHKVCITDSAGTKNRYYILLIKVSRAHKRQFDSSGQEMEPNFSQTTKVSTGFLNSSYKVEAKGKSDVLSEAALSSLVAVPELASLTKDLVSGDLLTLWLPEASAENMEIELGTAFRFKTQGNSPFICSMTRQEGQWTATANYAGGEQVGASWTDKIMAVKASSSSAPPAPSTGDDIIEDDEWDD
ncbi:arpin-like [Babylonia areolata]|uniref:arpin-like n=1 Tax=Babylonia areolata TaxID=304850 RepID=UPI003FD691A8